MMTVVDRRGTTFFRVGEQFDFLSQPIALSFPGTFHAHALLIVVNFTRSRNRRLGTKYQICLCTGKDVFALELSFDPSRRQWAITGIVVTNRRYPSAFKRSPHDPIGKSSKDLTCGKAVHAARSNARSSSIHNLGVKLHLSYHSTHYAVIHSCL